jgi:hypothetical protein
MADRHMGTLRATARVAHLLSMVLFRHMGLLRTAVLQAARHLAILHPLARAQRQAHYQAIRHIRHPLTVPMALATSG